MSAVVLGAGAWGTTLAWLLARGGQPVRLWSSSEAKRATLRAERKSPAAPVELPDSVEIVDTLADAAQAELLLFAVLPRHVRSLCRELAPHLWPSQQAVHAAKGFAPCGNPVSTVIDQETLLLRIGALGGPVVPDEIWAGQGSAAVVASRYSSVIDAVTDRLASEQMRVYGNRDLAGVEIAGAVRTPIAIAAGMLRGLGLGHAVNAVLLTRGIAEAGRLCEALGADQRTVSGLSGIGDWMLTVADEGDPLVQAGQRLARGGELAHDEAASRVATLVELAEREGVEMPITEGVAAILGGRPAAEVLQDLMTRKARPEFQ